MPWDTKTRKLPLCRRRGQGQPARCCGATVPPVWAAKRGAGSKPLSWTPAAPGLGLRFASCLARAASPQQLFPADIQRAGTFHGQPGPLEALRVKRNRRPAWPSRAVTAGGLAFERSTKVLAWSLSFLCSIFTLRNLGRRKEQHSCTPSPITNRTPGNGKLSPCPCQGPDPAPLGWRSASHPARCAAPYW